MTEWSVRSATEADRAAMTQLLATCYGSYPLAEEQAAWQTMVPEDAEVVVCDGAQIVGVASYVDLAMAVPGSGIRRVAGLTGLAVAPTHRPWYCCTASLRTMRCGTGWPGNWRDGPACRRAR